jgi:hypothetical protein
VGGNWQTISEGYASTKDWYTYEEMYDNVTPRFFSRSANGELIVNPLKQTWTRSTWGSYHWEGHRPPGGAAEADYIHSGCSYAAIGDAPADSSGLLTDLKTEAATALLAKINASAVQGIVIGGELKSTLNLLKSPLGGISRLIHKGSRRRLRSSEIYNAASNSWLSARYGWRPILYDIEDIMSAVNERHRRRTTVRANRSGSNTFSVETTETQMAHSNCTVVRDGTRNYDVRTGAIVEVSPDFAYSAGVRLRDIPRSVWDLLPYSFVADWFFNIGDYIDAIIPSSNSKVVASWTTTDQKIALTQTITPGQYSNYTDNPTGDAVQTRFDRVKLRSSGTVSAGLVTRIGSIQSLLSLKDLRLIDSIFLLTGKNKKKRILHHA